MKFINEGLAIADKCNIRNDTVWCKNCDKHCPCQVFVVLMDRHPPGH